MTLFERILKLHNPITFRPLIKRSKAHGQTDGTLIEIDLKSSVPVGKIFLHEALHCLFPTMPEKEVQSTESKLWKKLTQKDIHTLYEKLFSA